MSNDQNIVKEYLTITRDYIEKYGEKTVLLMQVGAFFEIYGLKNKDGDINGSRILDICSLCQLNYSEKKNQVDSEQVIMAGFRDYSLDKFLNKIVDFGYTAIVYTQEKTIKGITRDLQGIYSPGTLLSSESEKVQQITNNIMCIWIESIKGKQIIYGVSVVNIFTGKSYIFEQECNYLINPTTFDELERFVSVFNPSELIFISSFDIINNKNILQYIGIQDITIHTIQIDDNNLKIKNCTSQTYIQKILQDIFGENSQNYCTEFNTFVFATQSLCYLLDFIQEHNPNLIRKITTPIFNNTSDRTILANHTLKQLNIIDNDQSKGKLSSVLSFANKCLTSMGKRLFKYQLTNPTFDENWLKNEYDILSNCLENFDIVEENRKLLNNIIDVEKLLRQLLIRKITPSNIYNIYNSILISSHILKNISESQDLLIYSTNNENLESICNEFTDFIEKRLDLDNCKKVTSMLSFEFNIIKQGYSPELDEKIETQYSLEKGFNCIHNYFNNIMRVNDKDRDTEFVKKHETQASGISLQLTKKRASLLKTIISGKKEKNVSLSPDFSFSLDEIKITSASSSADEISFPLLNKILKERNRIQEDINKLIVQLFYEFLLEVEEYWLNKIEKVCDFVSKIDVIFSKTYISNKYNYCKPEIDSNSSQSFVKIEGLRHCLIEHIQTNELYVTNDLHIGCENQNGMLLYGTNAVGKTSLIRALGISIVLAQAGMFVPCSKLLYKPYTAIYSRILGNDNLFKGLSTFAVEISELRVILKLANENSLILGDEVCSGTETESALSIFVSALKNIHSKNSSFIFATHFHEIIKYDEIQSLNNMSIYHMHVVFDREQDCLIYDRKLKEGPGTRMYGLEVCKSLHLDQDFLDEAYSIRNKYFPENQGELSKKKTTYNAKKIRGICENCKTEISTEVHHMLPQQYADTNGYINGNVQMNHPANLMSLCEKCHNEMHKNGNKILKRKKTTKGYKVVEEQLN